MYRTPFPSYLKLLQLFAFSLFNSSSEGCLPHVFQLPSISTLLLHPTGFCEFTIFPHVVSTTCLVHSPLLSGSRRRSNAGHRLGGLRLCVSTTFPTRLRVAAVQPFPLFCSFCSCPSLFLYAAWGTFLSPLPLPCFYSAVPVRTGDPFSDPVAIFSPMTLLSWSLATAVSGKEFYHPSP